MNAVLEPPPRREIDRRSFLKLGALASGGLLIGTYLEFGMPQAEAAAGGFGGGGAPPNPNAYIRITPDGKVALMAPNSEMGQGAKTALPMIIAEELDVPWASVTVYQADLNAAFGSQAAVGSGSTPGNYTRLRQAGAMGRAMLITAAAQQWGVPESECRTNQGVILHAASGKKATYGELATAAAALPTPAAGSYTLKDAKNFKLLGTRVPGVDNAKIVTGTPLFGIDQKLPGMLYANFVRCPVNGGKAVSANLDEVKKLPGVRDAFILDGIAGLNSGVAIVTDSTWHAFSAAGKLQVQWDEGASASLSSDSFEKQADAIGNANASVGIQDNWQVLQATYRYPLLAHATMEPQNCTALYKDGKMEMWCPTQMPSAGQRLVTAGLGMQASDVTVHVTRVGGGFGRRGSNEFSLEVAAIAQKFEGTPIKLTWLREQDFHQDNYRSCGWHYFTAGHDSSVPGKILALGDNFIKKGGPGNMSTGMFPFNVIPGAKVNSSTIPGDFPLGYWRAPGDNGDCWAVQSFVDEMAHAVGRDPLDYRLDLLATAPAAPAAGAGARGGRGGGGMPAARMIPVIKLAGEKAGWGKTKFARGRGQGIAISYTNNACVAIIAEVTVTQAGVLHVDRMVAAVDAGLIVNLSSAENQVQGSMIDGLGAAWFLKVTVDKGRVQEDNFDVYPLMRISDAPTVVEAHFISSPLDPTGLGEPALPPSAPAVCNAIFAATGKRIRTLPIKDEDLKWS
ncbi:MAG TPA: molybdopterin cofactor-binding domain-containing protein [Opitutales bacterium]|jgi:isoquinoline 1-oxidoreductase beta subunit|nr:molybdopterin cofactor-binding domain-containing protein [Opitutales bacterium]